jgi:O-antigen ligase
VWALLVVALFPGLWWWFRRAELDGRSVHVVGVVLFTVAVEACLYGNQTTVPPGPFHPAIGGFSFRLVDAVVIAAVGARLTTSGIGSFRWTGLLWAAFILWLAAAAVIGVTSGNSVDQLTFQAKAIIYLLVIFLAAGVPIRDYVSRLPRWLGVLAVLAAILMVTSLSGLRVSLGARAPSPAELGISETTDPAGYMGADAATIFVAFGTVALGLSLYARDPNQRLKLALAAAPLLASPVLSEQRAAFLGFAVSLLLLGGLVAFLGRRPSATPTEGALALMAIAALILLPTLVLTARSDESVNVPLGADLAYSFTSQTEQLTTQDRVNQWEEVSGLVAEKPVFGWGLGKQYSYYEPGRREFLQLGIAHNIGWDLLLRSGVVGLALFVAALVATFARGLVAFVRQRQALIAALSAGLIAAIAGVVAKSMVESIFEKFRLAILLALLVGILLSAADDHESDGPPESDVDAEPA